VVREGDIKAPNLLVLVEIACPPPYGKHVRTYFSRRAFLDMEGRPDEVVFTDPESYGNRDYSGAGLFCTLQERPLWKTSQHRTYRIPF